MHTLCIHIAQVAHWTHIIVSLELLSFSWKQTPQNIGSSSLCSDIWAGEGLDSVFVACCFSSLWNGKLAVCHETVWSMVCLRNEGHLTFCFSH